MTETIAKTSPRVSRRAVLVGGAAAGGGLSLGVMFGPVLAQQVLAADAKEIGAWVVIKPDDTVVIRIARSEMGQGSLTGLAQLVAEELECDWAKVTTEYPTPGENLARGRAWGDMSTGGSRGIRGSHLYVRQGGAAARGLLLQAAAAEWKVPVEELTVKAGVITHAGLGRTTTYGRVAEAAAKLPVPKLETVKLKDPKSWTLVGKAGVKRLDTAGKLNGSQVYGIDLKLPGMLIASIMDAPVYGAKVTGFDDVKVKAMPGIKGVYRIGDTAVAVVADTWWRANQGVKALNITWEDTPNSKVTSETISAHLAEGLAAKENITAGNKVGDAIAALGSAAKKIEATYEAPYWHHVTMEPMNATAKWTSERCEVWVPTQNGEASLAAASEAAGLKPSQCEVYKINLGGGFGRRGFQDYVTKAVLLAKQIPGVPVKLLWSREEDMRQGRFRPVTMAKMTAGLDDKGNLVAFHMRLAGQSILATHFPARIQNGVDPIAFQGLNPQGPEGQFGYTIPNLLIESAMRNTHVPPGFWRGVNNNQNAVFLECFLEEVARASGKDSLEFRRALLQNHPKHLAVLNAVADKIGWTTSKPAEGQFRGLAQHMGYGSYVAAAAEVSITGAGTVKVHRIVMGTDCGHVVNPDQVEAQVVGSVAYGLSATMFEKITIKGGRIVEENLDTYEIMRLADFPKVETVSVPSGDFWGGVGEPTICVAAPAVLNAIMAATGKPVRTLPLKDVKLQRA